MCVEERFDAINDSFPKNMSFDHYFHLGLFEYDICSCHLKFNLQKNP